jgi:trehalose synthase
MNGFVQGVLPHHDAQLALAGPAVEAVSDDPEGAAVLRDVHAAWRRLPADARARVIIACLPMDDADENATIVNALQRRSDVIVQKSLAEGFGLTVSEAMWKSRPVVASRVGGIQDQIEHDRSGLLLDDPRDLEGLGHSLRAVLSDADRARDIGAAAQARVAERFTARRHLLQYAELIVHLLGSPRGHAGLDGLIVAAR